MAGFRPSRQMNSKIYIKEINKHWSSDGYVPLLQIVGDNNMKKSIQKGRINIHWIYILFVA